jgi:predicted nucleic acid-binding protein
VIILDTNVVSEVMRTAPSPVVLNWLARHQDQLYTTTVTLGEILYGIEIVPDGKRRRDLLNGADKMFTQVFIGRIFPFDEQAARAFATAAAARKRRGTPISELDAQIAAIAYMHGATLATRNTADFEGCDIRLVNPWVD